MSRNETSGVAVRTIGVIAASLAIASCGGGKHHLNQYEFSDKTLALVYVDPPSASLLHGLYDLRIPDNKVEGVVYAGGAVAKEIQARRAIARLDSASKLVDVSARLAKHTLNRASRYLGTRPVETADGADYVLEVTMRSFGLDARNSGAAYLFTSAETVLLERRTGREIWSVRVRGRNRLTPWVSGTHDVPSSIITAATLSTVSVDDFHHALDQLVTFSSNLIASELREKLRDARGN
jgi:hypothetical protein